MSINKVSTREWVLQLTRQAWQVKRWQQNRHWCDNRQDKPQYATGSVDIYAQPKIGQADKAQHQDVGLTVFQAYGLLSSL